MGKQPLLAPSQWAENPEYMRPCDESPPMACLSAEDHGCDITDPLVHYLGCIEICQRGDFFGDKNPIWEAELEYHISTGEEQQNADKIVENLKKKWKNNVESELRRIAILRKTLAKDGNDGPLVSAVEKSREEWRQSPGYKDNIGKVRSWRTQRQEADLVARPDEDPIIDNYNPGDYELEKDISVPVIQFDGHGEFSDTDPRLKGKFPNQKTTIDKLLYEVTPKPEDKLLHRSRDFERGRIKYFHISSNNMIWAEKAIAQYFGDETPNFAAVNRQLQRPRKTSASTILQERYWRGQLHGDSSSPPHARYLSPMCETISSPPGTVNLAASNIALFMPYLHWETSRKREQFASEIDAIIMTEDRKKADRETKRKLNRQLERQPITHVLLNEQKSSTQSELPEKKIETFDEAVEAQIARMENKKGQRRFQGEHKLGRYLLAAAHLCEGMTTYRDKKLLRKYLPLDPSIHPRRTLDQGFYWTLNSTKKRDRDQVVYRGTTANRSNFHQYDREKGNWPDHQGLNGSCESCKASIKKVSRVVMVDQLWMWVLDEKTIITCFPKRYGANKQDYSGVHKSIRTRLESLSPHPIRTVFELAIIILDECTKTFFDRAKSLDRQPQIIDEFSKAIGNIMHRQTLAFSRLWNWTRDAKKIYRSQGYTDTTGLHVPLLDINPEGHLEREIEDIIEELDIMLHIANIHQDIVKNFVEQVEHILDPNGGFGKRFRRGRTPGGYSPGQDQRGRQNLEHKTQQLKKEHDYQAFKTRADECQDRVDSHVKDLESLRKSAKNAADDVLHLLTMKQQQASVVQAWQAVKQSNETIKQGRSIMVFTLATIVFLPLSFLTSVFGMNNREFGDNNWKLKDQFLYIFLISAGVVFISLLFAYSAWVRACVWSLCTRISTVFLVKTGIYELNLKHRKYSDDIFHETSKKLDKLKMEKKKQVLKDKYEKRQLREEQERGEREKQENRERNPPETTKPLNGHGGSAVMGGHNSSSSTWGWRGSRAKADIEEV
ncbi:hypothetical protein HD806DRAFT_453892 [Xylariaceae sp. AK1471]|nr:hypothetical protein HD806DRAFT_453892 [Xylariaceae sp. AK1471]